MNNPAHFKRSEVKVESIDSIKYEYFHSHIGYSVPTLVFVHGYIGSMDEFYFLIRKFVRRYNVIAVNLPGVGRSSALKSQYDLENISVWLAVFLKGFKYSKYVLIGHSMGGVISTEYAFKYPNKIAGLICICTPSSTNYISPVWQKAMTAIKMACKSKPVEKMIAGMAGNEQFLSSVFPILERLHLVNEMPEVETEIKFKSIKSQDIHSAVQYADLLINYSLIPILKNLPDIDKLYILGRNDEIVNYKTYSEYRKAKVPRTRILLKKYFSHLSILINPEVASKHISEFMRKLRAQ